MTDELIRKAWFDHSQTTILPPAWAYGFARALLSASKPAAPFSVNRLDAIAKRLDSCATDIEVIDGLSRQPKQLRLDAAYLRKIAASPDAPLSVSTIEALWGRINDARANAGTDRSISIAVQFAHAILAEHSGPDREPAGKLVCVSDHDANAYCAILRILGMEEEGDPAQEVERLKALDDAAPAQSGEPVALRNIGYATLKHGELIHIRIGTPPDSFAEGYSGAPLYMPTDDPATLAQSAEPVATVRDRARWFVRDFSRDVGFAMSDAQIEVMLNLFLRYASPQPSPTAVVLDDERATRDAVTREQIDAWAKLAGINLWTEQDFERLGDFAIFARQARAASPQPVAQPVEQTDEPVAEVQFDDPRAQTVYAILCGNDDPPMGEHWEGWVSRRIVDALSSHHGSVPANVMEALERMCTPLDESVLKGATAAADAHSMRVMRDYVLSAAQPVEQTRALTDAVRDVVRERQRQMSVEGWTPEHDDEHANGDMALAAACYAAAAGGVPWSDDVPSFWPWADQWWKPTTARRDLVKAGALILAEIERLDRAAAHPASGEPE